MRQRMLMQPSNRDEAIQAARQFRTWCQTQDHRNAPSYLDDPALDVGFGRMLMGIPVHMGTWIAWRICERYRLWRALAIVAWIRIRTDGLSPEPYQCGYNWAYTALGVSKLRRGKVQEAIACLKESARIWPCPHNTTFGPRRRLADELEGFPEAREAVSEYREILQEFTA